MSIVVLCPSRGRPGKALEAHWSFLDTRRSPDTEMLFVIDEDDPLGSKYQVPLVRVPRGRPGMTDVVNHAAAPDRQHGIENLKEILAFTRRAQPDQRWAEQHIVAEGDLVVAYGRRDATWQASSFRGFDTAQNVPISVELAHMWRLDGGKIVEHWAVRDDLAMLQQLGAI